MTIMNAFVLFLLSNCGKKFNFHLIGGLNFLQTFLG